MQVAGVAHGHQLDVIERELDVAVRVDLAAQQRDAARAHGQARGVVVGADLDLALDALAAFEPAGLLQDLASASHAAAEHGVDGAVVLDFRAGGDHHLGGVAVAHAGLSEHLVRRAGLLTGHTHGQYPFGCDGANELRRSVIRSIELSTCSGGKVSVL